MRWLIVFALLLPFTSHAGEDRIVEMSRCGWLYMRVGSCAVEAEGEAVATSYFHRAFRLIQQRNMLAEEQGVSHAQRASIDNGISEADQIQPCSADEHAGLKKRAEMCP
jgi:hypothetical protein